MQFKNSMKLLYQGLALDLDLEIKRSRKGRIYWLNTGTAAADTSWPDNFHTFVRLPYLIIISR